MIRIITSMVLTAALILGFVSASEATTPQAKRITFEFKKPDDPTVVFSKEFRLLHSERSWEETQRVLYEKASRECLKELRPKRVVDEDEALDLVDICANPRISYSAD